MYTHIRTYIGVPQHFSKIKLSRSKAENKGCHSVLVAPRQCRWNKAQRGVGGLHPHTAPLSTVIQQGGRPNVGSEMCTRIVFYVESVAVLKMFLNALAFFFERNCSKCPTTMFSFIQMTPTEMMGQWVLWYNTVGQPGWEFFFSYLFFSFLSAWILKKQAKYWKLQPDMFSQIAHSWMASSAPRALTSQSTSFTFQFHFFVFL